MNMIALVAIIAATALDPGIGSVHYAVSTKNAQAQKFFDQGMAYMYGFNHEAAIRAFDEAARLDPNLAMAHWGKAYALGPNINLDVDPDREKQAYDAVQVARTKPASAKEKDLIDALAKRYTNDPKADLKKLALNYSNAMGALHKKYAADDDIATLYAESMMDLNPWKFWSHDGKPAARTEEIVSVLESVLKRNPAHVGANHFYIHAVEASPHPERALASAKQFATLAPASGHLVHMPAHIYQRTGNYAGAANANAKAADVDRAFIKKNGGEGIYPLMYYNHNLQFGSASYAMIGQYAEAKKMADEFAGTAMKMAKEMPMIETAAASAILIDARFAKWKEVTTAAASNAGPMSNVLDHFARGVAFARLGDTAKAEKERSAFEAAKKQLTDDPGFYQNSPKDVARVATAILDGRIAEAKKDRDKALRSYRQAVTAEDALNYDEPPDWYAPTRETLGGALLRFGQAAEAEKVFRADLEVNKNNPRSIFGLMKALEAQKKDAAKTAAAFKENWRGGSLKVEDL
jgi:tetratricopeptide (TPR) repeat protein